MVYTGINRVNGHRGPRRGASLVRTLRGFLEGSMSDIVNVNAVDFQIIDNDEDDPYHEDQTVEAVIEIDGQAFTFHAEGPSETDLQKVCGYIGVGRGRGDRTAWDVGGPVDQNTWRRIETFVRFGA